MFNELEQDNKTSMNKLKTNVIIITVGPRRLNKSYRNSSLVA
jgi:hypothetical protein